METLGPHTTDMNGDLLFGQLHVPSSDSDIDILFQLSVTQDPNTRERIQGLLQWVRDMSAGSTSSLEQYGLPKPSPSHLHCVAAILWHSYELNVDYDLPALLDRELFELLYIWSMSLPFAETTKKAVDSLMCSMCHINPDYFPLLLSWMGIVAPSVSHCQANMAAASSAGLTDDSEHDARPPVNLSASQLETLAAASQTPRAIKGLLDSGFPSALVHSLYQLCCGLLASADMPLPTVVTAHHQAHSALSPSSQPLLSPEQAVPVLHFLTEVGNNHTMKDWLGGPEASTLWTSLLSVLCHSSAIVGALGDRAGLATLEKATIAFFLQCISGHPNNQRLMAQLLCEIFQPAVSGNISDFIQKNFLQLILDLDKVNVFVQSPVNLYKGLDKSATNHVIDHPMYGAGNKYRTLHLPISTTLAEVLNQVLCPQNITDKLINEDQTKKLINEDQTEKKKKRKRIRSKKGEDMKKQSNCFQIYHKLLPGNSLPAELTLAQLLTLLYNRKLPLGYSSIDLMVKMACPKEEPMTLLGECPGLAIDWSLLDTSPINSFLEVFAGIGGLSLIAETQPMLQHSAIKQYCTQHSANEYASDWSMQTMSSITEHSLVAFGLFLRLPGYADILLKEKHARYLLRLALSIPSGQEGDHVLLESSLDSELTTLPFHVVRELFAQDSELPTLPFHVLGELFSSTPLTTDDGVLLRCKALEVGAIGHILSCISALSQASQVSSGYGGYISEEKEHRSEKHYWPKGTGFSSAKQHWPKGTGFSSAKHYWPKGTGFSSAKQHWPKGTGFSSAKHYWPKGTGFSSESDLDDYADMDSTPSHPHIHSVVDTRMEQSLARIKQHLQEDYVVCLFQALTSYINPEGRGDGVSTADTNSSSNIWPSVLREALGQSCLIPFVSSYLRNDSVLDLARHVHLYRALMELLRAICTCTELVPLLLPQSGEECSKGQTSISMLLAKMKTCTDTYTNITLSKSSCSSKKGKSKGVAKSRSYAEPDDGLALLASEIQRTAGVVCAATDDIGKATQGKRLVESSNKLAPRSLEEKYFAAMKKLQFGMFEMVHESDAGTLQFKVNYHYNSLYKQASSAARSRRLAQEAATLSTSLPLSSSSSVFVRFDDERLDIMKVLITGPVGSPYANGCFEFDVFFPQDYPNSPPQFNLETTGHQSVRFNPNLYADGKVCLSILNTWSGTPEEKWNPQTSSLLQVLVSLQSLILVPEPFFNEPGCETMRGTPNGTMQSLQFDANIRQATVKWAMLNQILHPSPCFKEVIHKHFYLKQSEIIEQCKEWIADKNTFGPTASHAAAALKKHTAQLQKELLKLPRPEGLEPN